MKNSDWAFNLRATANLEDSSESDSDDCAALLKNNLISPEAQLLKDLDLSSRHETVEYKPNPWNIAKMNAVSRTTRPSPDHGTIINPVRAKNPFRGRIVDLFKTQSEKPHQTGGIKLDDPVHRTPSEKPVVVCRDRLPINVIRKDAPQVVGGVPGNILPQENIQKYARTSQGYQSIVNPQPRPRPAEPVSISTSFSSPLPDHNRRVRQRTTWNSHSAFHSSPIKLTHSASRFMNNTSGMAGGGEGVGELDSRFRASRRSQKMGAYPHSSFMSLIFFSEDSNFYPHTHFKPRTSNSHSTIAPQPQRFRSPLLPRYHQQPTYMHTSPVRERTLPHINNRPLKRTRYAPPPASTNISPARTRSTQPTKTLRKDAYAFNASDPDAEWSTLPSRKKETRESGKFRLPIKIPGRGSGSGEVEEAGTKRRVITYLPPPKVVAVSQVVVENAGSNEAKYEETFEDAATLNEKSVCSPRSQFPVQVRDPPGRSSPTLIASSSPAPEGTLHVDIDAIAKKYPDTRAMMSKVRIQP